MPVSNALVSRQLANSSSRFPAAVAPPGRPGVTVRVPNPSDEAAVPTATSAGEVAAVPDTAVTVICSPPMVTEKFPPECDQSQASETITSTVVEEVVIADPVTEAPQSAGFVSSTPRFHGAYGEALTVAFQVFGVIVSDQPSISTCRSPGGNVGAIVRSPEMSIRDPTVQPSHDVGAEVPVRFAIPIRSSDSDG